MKVNYLGILLILLMILFAIKILHREYNLIVLGECLSCIQKKHKKISKVHDQTIIHHGGRRNT